MVNSRNRIVGVVVVVATATALALNVVRADDDVARPDGSAGHSQSQRIPVSETVYAANGRRWRVSYELEIDERAATVMVGIRLVPGSGVTPVELQARSRDWKALIEAHWSDRMTLVIGRERALPLKVKVEFRAHDTHHMVAVLREPVRADAMAWPLFPKDGLIAHEFGHLIGAFDEYPGGGTDPAGAVVDPQSVMAAGGGDAPRARQFWHVLRTIQHLAETAGWSEVRLVPSGPAH